MTCAARKGLDAAETIGRMIELFPPSKHAQIVSILAGVLRGVISQRLLPRIGGGRVPAIEVMVSNARIADLIREQKAEEIVAAIAEGEFYEMQTFSKALIDLVLAGRVERETAANAATNRHDFEIALEHALKTRVAEGSGPLDGDAPVASTPEPKQAPLGELRLAGS